MNINTFFAKLALNLHTFSYKLVSHFAIKAERGLHPKHRLMNYHQFFLDNINASDSVLDIGSNNGALTYEVAKKARKVMGVEIDEAPLAKARANRELPNLTYVNGDATKHFTDEKFDVVILSNVLEHIEDRKQFLLDVKHLAPKFLIRVPMIDREWPVLYKKELGLEWRLDSTHFTEFTLASFTKELREAGYSIKESSVQFGEIWAVVMTG
jgi:2-polyprenyl-3-methyl-5-hydroxy-6-metoxy-1,4-benzoquinol methylase